MAGEMTKSEVTRESYPLHFAIADAFGGTVQPFDQYQGPYVSIGPDVRGGSGVYATAPRLPGVVRLWIQAEGDSGFVTVYNEDNQKQSKPFPWGDTLAAVDAANYVLAKTNEPAAAPKTKLPPACPKCHGETELGPDTKHFTCFFCGMTGKID